MELKLALCDCTREVTGNNSSHFMAKPKNGQDYEAETLTSSHALSKPQIINKEDFLHTGLEAYLSREVCPP